MKYINPVRLLVFLIVQLFFLPFASVSGCTSANIAPNEKDSTQISIMSPSGTLENLGPQVFEKSINGSCFAKDKDDNLWLYTVQRASPARLLGYNLSTGSTIASVDLPLEGAFGSWSVVQASDGILYVASDANAFLYKHTPGSNQVQNLGKVLDSESYLWELTVGKDGEIFGGTYPGAKVFRYHPDDGFMEVSRGAVKEGEQYVRSLVYHKSSDQLFAGVGSHTSLIKLNPRTGEKQELLAKENVGHAGFVYYLRLIENTSSSDKLLITITGTKSNNKTLVYNLEKQSYEKEMGTFIAKTAIKSPLNDQLYFTSATKLYSVDLGQANAKQITLNENSSALASTWLDTGELCFVTGQGKLIKYNVDKSSISEIQLDIPAQPISINTVAYGPDGSIWTSGYPIGSNAAYNPKTKSTNSYNGLGQSESISYLGDDIFFAIYPGAKIYKYNIKESWSAKANPKLLGSISEQDRLFAYASVPSLNKMFFGTVPHYGVLGGSIVEYDKKTNALTSVSNLIKDQSIVSLFYINNELYGGTSIWGGLGALPTTTDAVLFTYDPATKNKKSEIIPVRGAKAITSLFQGPDSNLWGMADGTLFIFDIRTKSVLSTHILFDVSPTIQSSHVWKNASLIQHKSGRIFGVAYNEFFELDPIQKTKKTISTSATNVLAMDTNGEMYFHKGVDLWKYTP